MSVRELREPGVRELRELSPQRPGTVDHRCATQGGCLREEEVRKRRGEEE